MLEAVLTGHFVASVDTTVARHYGAGQRESKTSLRENGVEKGEKDEASLQQQSRSVPPTYEESKIMTRWSSSTSSLGIYLSAAEYIDSDHAEVAKAAAEWSNVGDTTQTAVRLFRFVRDLPYEADDFDVLSTFRASHVLEVGHGYCVSKASLCAALARAARIPARIGFADVRNHLSSPRLRQAMGTDVFAWHGYTEFYLDGRWIKASPTFDRATCEKAGVAPLEFDGTHDALLQAFDGSDAMEYLRFHGTYHDVPARFLSVEMLRLYPFTADRGISRYKAASRHDIDA